MEIAYFGLIIIALISGYTISQVMASHKAEVVELQRDQEALAEKLNAQIEANQELNAKLQEMESCARRKHNPYQTNAGLEDAIAVLMDAKQEKEIADLFYKQKAEYVDVRIESAVGALRKIRQDPSSYDMDAPNGKKSTGGAE